MKKIFIMLTMLVSTVYADPCTYLNREQCNYEQAYCDYQEGYQSDGYCETKPQDVNNPFIANTCKAANGIFWISQPEHSRRQYCQSNGCIWTPAQYRESVCVLKQAFR